MERDEHLIHKEEQGRCHARPQRNIAAVTRAAQIPTRNFCASSCANRKKFASGAAKIAERSFVNLAHALRHQEMFFLKQRWLPAS
jgi:hypothetical protein